jgi:hypothetical protein
LTFENHRKSILQSVVDFGIEVVEVAIADQAVGGSIEHFLVLLVQIQHVRAGPELNVVNYLACLPRVEVVQSLQHFKAVEGHDSAETVTDDCDSPVICETALC